jgi:adenine/guanine phosphoribosyltransferase-like PRPP-binding protein
MSLDGFVRPTTEFWQRLSSDAPTPPPFRYGYPARLPDGRILELPVRRLPGEPPRAVASLIANQASFEVVRSLAAFMTDLARPMAPEIVVGLPTLGFAFAPLVAEALGHPHYVPLGYSRKFWYDDALAEPVRSLTTPGAGKMLFVDPNLLPRVRGRRVLIVDDAVSSGQTAVAALRLMRRIDAEVAGLVVAMKQGNTWRHALAAHEPHAPGLVHGAFECPRLRLCPDGWVPEE